VASMDRKFMKRASKTPVQVQTAANMHRHEERHLVSFTFWRSGSPRLDLVSDMPKAVLRFHHPSRCT
jgi:hypothetical protein